ncbi:hypothetical protein SORBI_3001G526050 [Sorghum bicolor]|uniref:Uncharacterized protein n=1 Tax=Sorghum bicolor TaxID=4558 RepID=A0A1Z5SBQ8_SORBI|nr:hypothetical protein SORBI_3001G526050 [Sorghum bicolor]
MWRERHPPILPETQGRHVEPPAAARARQPLTAGPRGRPFSFPWCGSAAAANHRNASLEPGTVFTGGNGKGTPVAHGCPARIALTPWSVWLVGLSRPWPPTIFENARGSGSAALGFGLDPDENLDDPAAGGGLWPGQVHLRRLGNVTVQSRVFRTLGRLLEHDCTSSLSRARAYMFSAEKSESFDSAEIVRVLRFRAEGNA